MNNTIGVVLSILAALGGMTGIAALMYVIPTSRKLNSEAKKAGAEASEVVAKGATLLLVPLQQQIVGLQDQVAALEKTLALERRTSQEERLVAQETILGLRHEIARKDRRIVEFENHLTTCNSLTSEGGPT